jgi:hypothetical protein
VVSRISFCLSFLVVALSGCASGASAKKPHAAHGNTFAPDEVAATDTTLSVESFSEVWRGDSPTSLLDAPSPRRARHLGKWEISGAFANPIASGEIVPAFQLIAPSGEVFSDLMVGEQAILVVFFASWSELCARKVDTVRTAAERVPGAKLVFVSLDGPETAQQVAGFMREHRLAEIPVVDGWENPAFLASYNPTSSLPHVAVVGKSGQLIAEQVGLRSGDGGRLEQALRRALTP